MKLVFAATLAAAASLGFAQVHPSHSKIVLHDVRPGGLPMLEGLNLRDRELAREILVRMATADRLTFFQMGRNVSGMGQVGEQKLLARALSAHLTPLDRKAIAAKLQKATPAQRHVMIQMLLNCATHPRRGKRTP